VSHCKIDDHRTRREVVVFFTRSDDVILDIDVYVFVSDYCGDFGDFVDLYTVSNGTQKKTDLSDRFEVSDPRRNNEKTDMNRDDRSSVGARQLPVSRLRYAPVPMVPVRPCLSRMNEF